MAMGQTWSEQLAQCIDVVPFGVGDKGSKSPHRADHNETLTLEIEFHSP